MRLTEPAAAERANPTAGVGLEVSFRVLLPGWIYGADMTRQQHLSPVAATGVLTIGEWVRDDLPDLLWPALFLADAGSAKIVRLARWQKAVQADLAGRVDPQVLADGLDGRLTSLNRLVEAAPEARNIILAQTYGHEVLPRSVARVLAAFPDRPAAWFVDVETTPLDQPGVNLLARAVLEAVRDGHREALIKCLTIWSAVQARTFRADKPTIALLKPYPNDPVTRSAADSMIRASWDAERNLNLLRDPTRFDGAAWWAETFWGINAAATRCVRRRETDQPSDGATGTGGRHSESAADGGERLRRSATTLLSDYAEALEAAPARHYAERERQEVHAGFVARAGRAVIAALGAPGLWSLEHGAHVTKLLVEARIHLRWMAFQDYSIYRVYREHGEGKERLYARIAEEMSQTGITIHRAAETEDSFAGRSLRAMAEECGLLDLYQHVYLRADGATRSEWWAVATDAVEQCRNILHRGHLIPALDPAPGGDLELAASWVHSFHELIGLSRQILGMAEETAPDEPSPPADDEALVPEEQPA